MEPVKDKITYYKNQKEKFVVAIVISATWDWKNEDIVETGYSLESDLLVRLAELGQYVDFDFSKVYKKTRKTEEPEE